MDIQDDYCRASTVMLGLNNRKVSHYFTLQYIIMQMTETVALKINVLFANEEKQKQKDVVSVNIAL